MEHILFKIKTLHFNWSYGKIYEESGKQRQARDIHGFHTVRLTPSDLRELADIMDRTGLRNIRIVKDRNGFYVGLNE